MSSPITSGLSAYLRSPSTILAFTAGALMYLSYAALHGAWTSAGVLFVGVFVALALPTYSKWSNKVEERIGLVTASVTAGRLGRGLLQYGMNLFLFAILIGSGAVPAQKVAAMGGILGIALVTTAISQGVQYLALMLANRDIGNRNRNVLIAIAGNIILTAIATLGLALPQMVAQWLGIACGVFFFGVGLASDVRGRLHPRGGVGMFFGTFNPMHRTHIEIIRRAIAERGLEKVYVHPTCIPKLHSDALAKGEIEIVERKDGRRVYGRTAKADVIVNYFPTGREFYEEETRVLLARLAIADAGLSDVIEVVSFPEVYRSRGFHGVVRKIRGLAPGRPLHGIHGSDLGGMMVRSIYDECGWIHPYAVRRIDGVSATAIRNGATGMAMPSVETVLSHLREGDGSFVLDGRQYVVLDGVVTAVPEPQAPMAVRTLPDAARLTVPW